MGRMPKELGARPFLELLGSDREGVSRLPLPRIQYRQILDIPDVFGRPSNLNSFGRVLEQEFTRHVGFEVFTP